MWTTGLELEMEPPSCLAGVGARPKWNGSTTLGLITITAIFSDPQFTFKNIFNFHYCHIYCPEPVPSDVWQWQKVQNQLKRHMLSIENRALISDSSSCLLDMDESSSRPAGWQQATRFSIAVHMSHRGRDYK